MFLRSIGFSRRRFVGAFTAASFIVVFVSAPSMASVPISMSTGEALGAPAATGALRALATNLRACDELRMSDVVNDVARMQIMRSTHLLQHAPVRAPHLDPVAFRAFVLRTYPKTPVPTIPTAHAMTAVEYATFRAVGLVHRGLSVVQAVHACRAQATAVARARPSSVVCAANNCEPTPRVVAHDSAGGRGQLTIENNQPSSATTLSPSGTAVGNGQVTAASLGGVWIANPNGGANVYLPGPIPAMQTVRSERYNGKTFSYTLDVPDPGWVPQNGWVVVPGTPFWAYLDNANKFMVIELDSTGNDFIEVWETASGGFQMYLHAVNAAGQVVTQLAPVAYNNNGSGAQNAREAGAIRPDVSPGEALLGLGGAVVAVGVGLLALIPVAGVLAVSVGVAATALILDGGALIWVSPYVTDGTVSEDWSDEDGYADFGEGGGGYSDPGIDEDVW